MDRPQTNSIGVEPPKTEKCVVYGAGRTVINSAETERTGNNRMSDKNKQFDRALDHGRSNSNKGDGARATNAEPNVDRLNDAEPNVESITIIEHQVEDHSRFTDQMVQFTHVEFTLKCVLSLDGYSYVIGTHIILHNIK